MHRIDFDSYPVPFGLPSLRIRRELGRWIVLDVLTFRRRFLLGVRLS